MTDRDGKRYADIVLAKMLATAQETPDGVAITLRPHMIEEAFTEIGQCFVCGMRDHVGPDCAHLPEYVKSQGGIKDDFMTLIAKDDGGTGFSGLIERRSPEGERLMQALGLTDG